MVGGSLPASVISITVEYPRVCSVSHPEQRLRIFNLHCVLAWALMLIDKKPIKLKFCRLSNGYSGNVHRTQRHESLMIKH